VTAGTTWRASWSLLVDIEHKGGRTFGLRIDGDRRSLQYLRTTRPRPGCPPLMAMLDRVDVLVHDAQFLEPERPAGR
jgi:hypothetical protein